MWNSKKVSIESERDREIWNAAIRECLMITALDAGGMPGPQADDIFKLIDDGFDWDEIDWDNLSNSDWEIIQDHPHWTEDKEFWKDFDCRRKK